MPENKATLIEAIGKLSFGVVALLILAGSIWVAKDERRFEAERADRDRLVAMELARSSLEATQVAMSRQEDFQDASEERAVKFLEQQRIQIQLSDRLAKAQEDQARYLQTLVSRRDTAVDQMLRGIHDANSDLIRTLSVPVEEREDLKQ